MYSLNGIAIEHYGKVIELVAAVNDCFSSVPFFFHIRTN